MSDNILTRPLLDPLLQRMFELKASDMYLTVGCPPTLRVEGSNINATDHSLTDSDVDAIIVEILDQDKRDEFYTTMEFNLPLQWHEGVRFRINVFRQQQHSGLVVRRIENNIPTIESLDLPKAYGEMIMENRGLILIVGTTGSGKTTSLAAMADHRNRNGYGHILTIEDPIEYIHTHKQCIITQRDVGIDTYSFGMALKNALRQRPDVVIIGEIRDRETMEHALYFSETGHLCVATLHAGNTCQTIERVLNFFPEERHAQTLHSLSNNLRAILSQRLVLSKEQKRKVAVEVMFNRGLIRNLIQENKIKDIPDIIGKNNAEGMQTFDQALYKLYAEKVISEEVAVSESDSPANIRLLITQANNAHRTPRAASQLPTLGSKPSGF